MLMANDEALPGRRRALEEQYFQKQEQELIAKLRKRGEEAAARRRLAETIGVADEEILQDLQALGYTPETVMLLHLVPLVQVAWAEGNISDSERRLIMEAARARGIEAGSAADRQLAEWLATRPSDAFFERTLRAIQAMLQSRPAEEREASRRDLLAYCSAIAAASGGILGFGKVSEEERQLLTRLTNELERTRASAAEQAVRPRPGDV
jgi:hypothetical protein